MHSPSDAAQASQQLRNDESDCTVYRKDSAGRQSNNSIAFCQLVTVAGEVKHLNETRIRKKLFCS